MEQEIGLSQIKQFKEIKSKAPVNSKILKQYNSKDKFD